MAQYSAAPQNLREFEQWRDADSGRVRECSDSYLRQVDRKWRVLGKLAAQPAAAALRRGKPVG